MSDDEQPIVDAQEPPSSAPATKHCKNCGREVVPSPRGSCPTCGRILPGARFNFNHRGPVGLARRDEILGQILEEYKPRTVVLKLRCLHLASAYAQLESTTAGTTEFQRLVGDSQKLVDELEAARKTDDASAPPPIESLSNDELISRLEALLAAAREWQRKPEPVASQPAEPEAVSENDEDHPRASNAAAPDPSAAHKSDESEGLPNSRASAPTMDTCRYCNGPCVGESHPSYFALHPEAAQARDDTRRDNEFRQRFGLPVERDEPTRPEPTDAEKRAAHVREALGWDRGVWNERTGYRHQE